MLKLSPDELLQIKNVVQDKEIFLAVDESALSGIQYLNIIVGILEILHVSCQPLPCVPNSNSIARAVDDTVRSLEIKRNFFCLSLSDAAKYTVAAGAILKSL